MPTPRGTRGSSAHSCFARKNKGSQQRRARNCERKHQDATTSCGRARLPGLLTPFRGPPLAKQPASKLHTSDLRELMRSAKPPCIPRTHTSTHTHVCHSPLTHQTSRLSGSTLKRSGHCVIAAAGLRSPGKKHANAKGQQATPGATGSWGSGR